MAVRISTCGGNYVRVCGQGRAQGLVSGGGGWANVIFCIYVYKNL